ncbi:hypothetical protein A4E84_27280 [Streptomyces qaidamensis]|uniref:S1 motif domain-containing protein n=1 Tax=Streptomyces qaidamensis TaxID=1783515 RepID=A0A143C7B8_9ACTN|nr:hypothetical protein [Streptomyces qaidamensis]AMW12865.1 hypothetical protein A4E84_27280 [Streptomyces qaidamensis]
MSEFSWPDRSQVPTPEAINRSWRSTVAALPLGSHVSGRVVARQPFGVFLLIDGVSNALGLAEITAMPHHMELPAMGATVAGEVIWHADRNRQVKIRLDEWALPNSSRLGTTSCTTTAPDLTGNNGE